MPDSAHLDVAAHNHLSRVVEEDERQAGMATAPGEEIPGLVQLDRHHLPALQVVVAQHLLALDKVVFHRCPSPSRQRLLLRCLATCSRRPRRRATHFRQPQPLKA